MPYVVLCPTSKVKMSGIEVTIIAIEIREGCVRYEVSWIYNGDRKTAWVDRCEIDDDNIKITEVGFTLDQKELKSFN